MNQDFAPFALFGLVVVVVIALAIWGGIAERKRREALQALAQSLGLAFLQRDSTAAARFGNLDALRQGNNQYAYNLLRGAYKDHPVEVFDYHYETYSTDSKGRRQTHHHYLNVYTLMHEGEFSELRIYPESFLGRLAEMIGFDDIDFESVEFSRAFTVRATDRRFAYDICHTRMMEYLLQHRDLSIEIDGPYLAIVYQGKMQPERVIERLDQVIDIRSLFPQYLYRA